jgi:hypothetical protein
MSATIQVQRAREQDLAVRVVSVESRMESISLRSGGARAPTAGRFDFDVDLHESSRTKDTLNVRYSFKFGNPASGQTCKVSGRATLRFSQFNPEADFHSLGNDITSEMAVAIFRSNYESTYLLLDALGMEAPSPWITQDVSLSSRSQVAA